MDDDNFHKIPDKFSWKSFGWNEFDEIPVARSAAKLKRQIIRVFSDGPLLRDDVDRRIRMTLGIGVGSTGLNSNGEMKSWSSHGAGQDDCPARRLF